LDTSTSITGRIGQQLDRRTARTRDLHVGLLDEPVTTHAMAACPSRVDEQRGKPLDPSEQGHVVDLNPTFGEQLLQIPIGQSLAHVPTDGNQDDLRREPESTES
jgi:hypothetical protein